MEVSNNYNTSKSLGQSYVALDTTNSPSLSTLSDKVAKLFYLAGVDQNAFKSSSLDVYIQDQHSRLVDVYFTTFLSSASLSASTVIDNNLIYLNDGHGSQVGNIICLKDQSSFYQGQILSIDGNILSMDSILDHPFPLSAHCSIQSNDLSVDGSETPKIFRISPMHMNNISWDITRIMGIILDGSNMDGSKFGGISALTKGVLFRKTNGESENMFNIKSNSDLSLRCFDMRYDDRAAGNGAYEVTFKRDFSGQHNNGVTIRLNDTDILEIVVQDDLRDLDRFNVIGQGHYVEN